MKLAERIFTMTRRSEFGQLREVRDQIRRAALSVSNNIAEGFERGTTAELLSFLYIARGSAGEVRSMLIFCERLGGTESEISNLKSQMSDSRAQAPDSRSRMSDLRPEIAELKSLAESCSRQIRAWADHLQNSDIQGQRRLNDQTRQAWQATRSTEAFLRKLQDIRDSAAKSGAKQGE